MEEEMLSSEAIKLLTPVDVQFLKTWNGKCPSARDICVTDSISDRVGLQPHSPAISSWDGEFTYAQVDAVSTQLTRRLLDGPHGDVVRQRRFIGILMDKSRWTVIACLAVIKAGAAFVFLDGSHPAERLRSICQDVDAGLILISTSQKTLASTLGIDYVPVDDESLLQADPVNDANRESWTPDISPNTPMCALFTSGSTGRPKGTVVSHRVFMSGAGGMIERLELNPQSRVFQFAAHAFDAAVIETILVLIAGGCICIPSDWQRKNELSETIDRLQANWLFITPSMARVLRPEHLPSLRRLIIGGESLSQSEVDLWSSHVKLAFAYGPTEAPPGMATITLDQAEVPHPSSIGTQMDLRCWVVDPQDYNKLMPVGTEGELLLEGHALTEGYIDRPEQTAAAYIDPPTWMAQSRRAGTGRKLYRTGDLVRYNQRRDGSLNIIGRKDTQVKLRGQRVEMGDIESQVRTCFSTAKDAIAEVVSVEGRTPQLCLFLYCPGVDAISKQGGDQSSTICGRSTPWFDEQTQNLRSTLEQRLPEYMLPDRFIPVTALPMTVTGKTDRKKIREDAAAFLAQMSLSHSSQFIAEDLPDSSTDSEKLLRKLWADVLNVPLDVISLQSNWLDLGANSVLTIQLVDRASRDGLQINVRDVLQSTDLSALAGVAKHEVNRDEAILPLSLLSNDKVRQEEILRQVQKQYEDLERPFPIIEDIYPCTYDQTQSIDLSALRGANLTLQADFTEFNAERFCKAWQKTVQETPILRTQIIEVNGKRLQVVMKDCPSIDVRPSPASPVTDIWGWGKPLLQLIQYAGSDQFTILFHHAIHDGFSLELFLQQLAVAYSGEQSPPVQPYTSFVKWTSQTDSPAEEFWTDMFRTYDATSNVFPSLPHPEYAPQGSSMLQKKIHSSQQSVHRATTEAKLRLALAVAMGHATGNSDVVFGIHISRRDAPLRGIASIPGPTLGTVPARVQLNGQETLKEALDAVQDQALKSIPFQRLDLDRIRDLNPNTRAACRFQTTLMLQVDHGATRADMFANWQFQEEEFRYWSLCFVAQNQQASGCLDIWTFFDEGMISTSQVQDMLDRIEKTLDLIEQDPEIRIEAIA